ncbi:MAG: cupredoxin domain-containing protein [Coriobacteriia bacterium]
MRNNKWRTLVIVAALAVVMLAVAGCAVEDDGSGTDGATPRVPDLGMPSDPGDGGVEPVGENEVIAQDFSFAPATIEVSVGDTVTWTNRDSAIHDIEIEDENLGSMGRDESVTWTAEAPGTYPYVCTIHPAMQGEIVVR